MFYNLRFQNFLSFRVGGYAIFVSQSCFPRNDVIAPSYCSLGLSFDDINIGTLLMDDILVIIKCSYKVLLMYSELGILYYRGEFNSVKLLQDL